jgi:hypothetical protein
MKAWSEPKTVNEWARRAFGLRPLVLGLMILAMGVSELRFDWIEHVVGDYLVSTNGLRPQSGAIWDVGRKASLAQQTLEQIVTDRTLSRQHALEAQSFKQIAASLEAGQGVMLTPEHFRSLYLKLPRAVAHEITSPIELLRLYSDNRWVRTYFAKQDENLRIYCLDSDSRVLHRLEVSFDLLNHLEKSEEEVAGVLERWPQFEKRIYPADRFFSVMAGQPEDIRRGVIPQPEILLQSNGSIIRVGISDEAVSGFIELGFEFQTPAGSKVIRIEGHRWAVMQLRNQLEAGFAEPSPSQEGVTPGGAP